MGERCSRTTLAHAIHYQPSQALRRGTEGARVAAWRAAATELSKAGDKAGAKRVKELLAEELARQEEAARAAEAAASSGSDGAAGAASGSGSDSEESDGPRPYRRTRRGRAAANDSTAAVPPPGSISRDKPADFDWYEKPSAGAGEARGGFALKTAMSLGHLESHAAAAEAARAAELAAALDAAEPLELAVAPPPRDIASAGPYGAIVRTAAAANDAAAGADLALVGEDDPRFRLERAVGSGACALCQGTMHFGGNKGMDCPVLQAALAAPKPPPTCVRCALWPVPGCDACIRGKLPEHVWVPAMERAPWLGRVLPATRAVMHSVQGVASAAVVDFNRPDLAATLGPAALLAVGVLAEEVAAAELRTRQAKP